jgi:Protein of unknown function (DUF2827)
MVLDTVIAGDREDPIMLTELRRQRPTIGISPFARGGQTIWYSGIHQNIAFLAAMLKRSTPTGAIYFLNGGGARALPNGLDLAGLDGPVVQLGEVTHVHFSNQLDIVSHGIATFAGRYAAYEFMAAYGDAVVSHARENGQNYLYYELLCGGYPLIHNSPFLGTAGYFYPVSTATRAGECWRRHLPSTARVSTHTESGRSRFSTRSTSTTRRTLPHTRTPLWRSIGGSDRRKNPQEQDRRQA